MIDWLVATLRSYPELAIFLALAEDHGIVLLNGSGFKGPDWSCRVSFANLEDRAYEDTGRAIRSVGRGYYQAFRVSKGLSPLAPNQRMLPA
jgi:aspartate 4-decarboxylase